MGVTVLKKENISDAVIRRLPRYYRQLTDLCARGVVRISSHSLGQEMNITASQIRQDFSCFGEFGQQGYGYNVEELRAEIGHILGVDNDHHLIMIGVGNLGHALLQNFRFSQTGFSVDAAFDISPTVVGTSTSPMPSSKSCSVVGGASCSGGSVTSVGASVTGGSSVWGGAVVSPGGSVSSGSVGGVVSSVAGGTCPVSVSAPV